MEPPRLEKKVIQKLKKACFLFGLSSIDINIYPVDKVIVPGLEDCAACFMAIDNEFRIEVDFKNLNDSNCLIHELTHVKQFLDGRLQINKRGFVFDGKRISLKNYAENYDDIKFEKEAYFWGDFLAKDRKFRIVLDRLGKKSIQKFKI